MASVLAAIVSLGESLYEHYKDRPLSAYMLLVLSVGAFWLGTYRAWEKKADELDQEKARNAKPEIAGRVVHAVVRMFGSSRNHGIQTPTCDIAIKLAITGKTAVDATLKDAELLLEAAGRKYIGQRLSLSRWDMYQYSDRSGAKSEKMNDLIASITYSNPIRYRIASDGWLDFLVEGLALPEADMPLRADMTITLVDELGDKHVIVGKDVVMRH